MRFAGSTVEASSGAPRSSRGGAGRSARNIQDLDPPAMAVRTGATAPKLARAPDAPHTASLPEACVFAGCETSSPYPAIPGDPRSLVATTLAPGHMGARPISGRQPPVSRRGRFGPGEYRRRESDPASRNTTTSGCIDERHITTPRRFPARGPRSARRQGTARGPGQGVRRPRRKGPAPPPAFARTPQSRRTGFAAAEGWEGCTARRPAAAAPAAAFQPTGCGRRSS